MYRVIEVRPLEHLRLYVRFDDGTSGEVMMKSSHLTGVFECLGDPEYFLRVRCDSGFVEWPDEIDLAPDAMYEAISATGHWILD